MSGDRNVTVLGAGVVGLTTAWVLQEAGWTVDVIGDRIASRTSSRVAGAVWFPYRVENGDEASGWAKRSFAWLAELARRGEGGVRRAAVPSFFFGHSDSQQRAPDWTGALPQGVTARWHPRDALPPLAAEHARLEKLTGAWGFDSYIVHPTKHLEWLESELRRPPRRVPSLSRLGDAPDGLVVNCTGRRARLLTRDAALRPAHGQVLVSRDPRLPRDYAFADARDGHAMTYVIPRGPEPDSEVVLGGFDDPVPDTSGSAWTSKDSPPPRPDVTDRILARFAQLGLDQLDDIVHQAEWRPIRDGAVRVERVGDVIHDYGHGGAGFTMAYGCAEKVVELLGRHD